MNWKWEGEPIMHYVTTTLWICTTRLINWLVTRILKIQHNYRTKFKTEIILWISPIFVWAVFPGSKNQGYARVAYKGIWKKTELLKSMQQRGKALGSRTSSICIQSRFSPSRKKLLEEETANDALIMTREQHFLFLLINFEQMKWQPS